MSIRIKNTAGNKVLLSIAGYDPSSGAGVLLDVAVFRRFGFLGTGILTAVTAQNTRRVADVRCLGGRFLFSQYETLVRDVSPSGIKVGMLGCRRNIPALGRILAQHPDIPIVVDPVFRSSSGRWLLEKEAVPSYISQIKGRISVLTPNLIEATLISGRRLRDPEAMKEAARRIVDRIAAPCLVKGGHLARRVVDVLYDGRQFYLFPHEKVPGDVHGTGCFLSSSLLAYLVMGKSLAEACALASEFTGAALRKAVRLGKGREVLFSF
jgi:hydroxymethylpyrimidine/phosphomethylpyrimidine kinase